MGAKLPDNPDCPTSHKWRAGLPDADSPKRLTRKEDVRRAVKDSKNTMPGPDGIPYKAWRELGETGVDILWDVMQELKEEAAQDRLDEAYEGERDVNASIMVCPKLPLG